MKDDALKSFSDAQAAAASDLYKAGFDDGVASMQVNAKDQEVLDKAVADATAADVAVIADLKSKLALDDKALEDLRLSMAAILQDALQKLGFGPPPPEVPVAAAVGS